MVRNVYPFPGNPTIWNKLVVALAYLVLGYAVTVYSPGTITSYFFILGLLYVVLIHRRRDNVKYFLRFHLLQALFLNLCFAMALWLLVTLLQLMATLPLFDQVAAVLYKFFWQYTVIPFAVVDGLNLNVVNTFILAVNIVLAVSAFRVRYPEVPWLSDSVRRFSS